MAKYELIKLILVGAPKQSAEGIVTQNINVISNQVGNTYESRYITDTVSPAPTFKLKDGDKIPAILEAAAVSYIAKKYPDKE